MRRLAVAFMLLCLFVAPAPAAASDYDNFTKAYDKRDYAKAAKIAAEMTTDNKSVTALERCGDACEYAGRIPDAIRFKTARLYHKDYYGTISSSVVFKEARAIGQLAARSKVQSEDVIIAAITALESGDTLGGLQQLHDLYTRRSYGIVRDLAADGLTFYLFPAIESAVLRNDREQAAARVKCRKPWPAPGKYKASVLTALEMGGDIEGAVRQAYGDVFTMHDPGEPYDANGNPTLLPIAAEIAHRNHYTSDIPLVAAYARHLAGDTKGAIAALERIARSSPKAAENDTACIARFLAGDLCRQQGDLRQALSWYHLATWADFDYSNDLYLTALRGFERPDPMTTDTFHRTLGAIRQASVLLAQGRPKLALEELASLVDLDRKLTETVRDNSTLFDEWKSASDAITARYTADSTNFSAGETLDSLGYYGNDWVVDAKGQLVPRRPARAILETVLAQHEARRQMIANERTAESMSDYFKQMQAAQAEAEAAKTAAEAPTRNARVQAFQFQQQSRSNVCVRCKGTGILYVPPSERQGWKYSEVDKSVVDTQIYTSAHMVKCHWCDGTGKR